MRKGITPVVAIVLLISITVTAAGTVYTYINAAQPGNVDAGQLQEDFKVSFESCWPDGTGYRFSVRNSGQAAFNTSTIDVNVNSVPENDYTFSQVIVNPQETFQVFVDGFNRGDTLELVKGDKIVSETCRIS